jgi:hypothetical protein
MAWVLTPDREHQERFNLLERRLQEMPNLWRDEIEHVRGQLTEQTLTAIKATEAELHMRLLGVGYVVAGLLLAYVGNIV